MASIEIKGVDKVIAKLGKVAAMSTLAPAMDSGMKRLQLDAKRYPPPPAGSTYRRGQDPRSEDLGGSWVTSVRQTSRGLIGKVGTRVSYAPWVMSHQFQARHMKHWNTDADILEKNRAAIVRDFEHAIEKAIT